MKKVFLFLTMLLFAFVGTMRADVVEIGSLDGAANNTYLPMNSLYEYSFSEQIYTAEEIGMAGTINSITMWLYGNENLYTMPFDIYMVEVDKDAFESTSDWVTVTAADVVYSGEVTVHNTDAEAFEFVLDTPFNYSGNGNLLIAFNNNTGSWKSGLNGKVFGATGDAVRAIYARRDSTPYDIANLPAATSTTYQRNVVTLDMTAGGGGGGEPATLTVYDGENTNSYVPVYGFYADAYLRAQYVIPAADLAEMNGGTVNQLTFYMTAPAAEAWTGSFEVYMTEVEDATISAFVDPANATTVYAGLLDATGETMVVTFTDTYVYNGGNLLIGFDEVETGNYKSVTFAGTTVEGASVQGYSYSSVTAVSPSQRNFIPKTTFDYITGGGPTPPPAADPTNITTIPEVLDLGYRPMGYWMEPYQFSFYNSGKQGTINSILNGSDAFTYVAMDLPAVIAKEDTLDAWIYTGTAPVAGTITEQFAIDYTGTRSLKMFEVTANAYEPEEGDVWELAQEVEAPFNGTAPAGIHKNYNLPNSVEGANDVIYKVTFEDDVMLTAGTNGANGVARIYTENFNGQPGPMVDNFYQYSAGGGYPPTDTWFGYDYTGSNTFFGTSAGGGMIYGYRVPASIISQFSYCYLTTVEAAARESYPYNLYVLRGGETPADAEIIYYQEMPEPATAMYFFDMDIEEPFLVGDEDLWVMFYSESPYAAYCGKEAVDVENAKIWYTLNGTTWSSNTTYTPVIYLHLEYPEPNGGEEVVLNLADMSMASFNTKGSVKEAKGNVNMPQHNSAVVAKPQRDGYAMLYNEFIPAGTYYIAIASTDENFDVYITTEPAPVPEPVVVANPVDGQTGVANGDMLQYTLGNYTREMQILLGTEYPPVNALVDWTDNLFPSMAFETLENNKIYFMQINERNSTGTTYGEIIGFTSEIDMVEGFAVEEDELYPGDIAAFSWTANRSIKGYNLYMDGEKVNETLITGTTYEVEDLEYNVEEGYDFQITAVFDEGESEPSEAINVKMTGFGTISGTVYEQDSTTVVPFATVMLVGKDEYNASQIFTFVTGEDGTYSGEIYAGMYRAYGEKDGYQLCEGDNALIIYGEATEDVNVIMYEYYAPLGQIDAALVDDNVEVTWSWTPAEYIVDFENGLMPEEFTSTSTYPWAITTTNPHEGTYCIKSTCEGIASATSDIEATVEVPYDAKMGFWVRVSSENNYDKFHFYIDGVEQGAAISGQQAYAYKEYTVAAGTHTYKWAYQKDSSVNSNDDCAYVDDITMYRKDEPLPPTPGGQTFNFDDNTMMGWTSIDADGDGNGWVSSANPGIYHNSGVSLAGTGHNASEAYVISGSYANQTGQALTPDNYLVSPTPIAAQNGAAIEFWACAQDASYAAEHFGVAVSTTTATAGAFTTIQEWTMTAKSDGRMDADVAPGAARGTRQGSWYQYQVDLSSYAGQNIYVAIRHFNCTDMFILNVDDITLGDGSVKALARGNRSLDSFKLYRRNNNVNEPVDELIATLNDTTFAYTDAAWSNLGFGVYQYGIQAYYEGNATPQDRDEIIIGEGATTNNYIPSYVYYCYSLTEQIFTADEIGTAGTINAISFFNTQANRTRSIAMYMVNTEKDGFAGGTDWENMTASDLVFEGEVTFVEGDWTTITLDTPFAYNGIDNLIVAVDDNTGSYENAVGFKADAATAAAIRVYSDGTNYDPTAATTYSGTVVNFKNNIKLDMTAGGGGSHDGLSEIIWSNQIEKDMYATVTVNVTLNNGQLPTGAAVALTGEGTYNGTADETGVVVIENVRKGAYTVAVTLEGYNEYNQTQNITEDAVAINVTLEEIIAPVEELYVSPTGYAMWGGNNPTPGPGPGPGPGPQPGQDETFDFDNSTMMGWTSIDGDGDGYGWGVGSTSFGSTGLGHNASTDMVVSASYINNLGALTPNNFLVSPTKAARTAISFWACGQDASYVAEHFGVAVSTTGNTSASDFTTVQEWTMTGKGQGQPTSATRSGDRTQGTYHQFTVDLSAYAGQEIWVAIRHFGCTDMFYLDVDDITLTAPAKNDRAALSYMITLDGIAVGETEDTFFQHNVTGFEAGSEHTTTVTAVYATGMGDEVSYTWTYADCDDYEGATEFAGTSANNNVTLTWTVNGSTPTPPGPNPPTPGQDETFDFDNSTMMGWTSIDGDGDGYGWGVGSTSFGSTGLGHNASTDMVVSASYINNLGALTPNNFLVSPTKAARTAISFWACGQDASYVAEHFGVAVSTTGNTSASDFTTVQEWTMTGKGQGLPTSATRSGDRTQGTYHEFTVDLSAYAGQEIWVAIRHFGCTDMFYLDVDDITLTAPAKGRTVLYEPHFVTDAGVMPNGADASWIKGSQSTYGPGAQQANGNIVADDFTLDAATTINEIEVYGYQTGSTTTSTFTGLYAVIYNGNPMSGGQIIWGDMNTNIMTSTSFTNAYRGSDGATTGTTRPIMALTASNLNIALEAGTYYLAWNMTGSGSSGPWAQPEAYPTIGNSGNGVQYIANNSAWQTLSDGGSYEPYGVAFKLVGEGGGPTPPTPVGGIVGVNVYRDGEFLGMASASEGYLDENLEAGIYEYCIQVVYDDYGMSCPQCISVEVSDTPIVCDPVTGLVASQVVYQGAAAIGAEWDAMPGAIGYKIAIDGEILGQITGNSVTLHNNGTPLPAGTYAVGVIAVYAECESDMVEVSVTLTDDGVNENEIVSAIYPNPTSSDLHINATAMTHVSVFNAMGQMVYDQAVSGDEMIINMGQYEAGIYMVRIDTENGSSVKRITVVK